MKKANNLAPIYIAGPTASGKSALAIKLARIYDSVVISADSMQIYRGLDIGTAKEDKCILDEIPHKLIDVVDNDAEFSVAEFANLARVEIAKAQNQGKLPIVVGGTGLYFEALLYPMSFANTIKNEDLRARLQQELETYGAKALHDKLKSLDIDTASKLHENDTKRVIRSLEIIISTGRPLRDNRDNLQDPDVTMICLNTDRQVLYDRINERVDQMFDKGLVNEVMSVGSFDYQSMQAIGYKEFRDCNAQKVGNNYVIDENELLTIKEQIKQHTRNYAKRQLTWFRKYKFVKWFDCYDVDNAIEYLCNIIDNN